MKYEYTLIYYNKKTRKRCGISIRRFDTKSEAEELAEMINAYDDCEFVRVARREICKWKVVK